MLDMNGLNLTILTNNVSKLQFLFKLVILINTNKTLIAASSICPL